MLLDVLQRIGTSQAARWLKKKAAVFEIIGIGIEVTLCAPRASKIQPVLLVAAAQ